MRLLIHVRVIGTVYAKVQHAPFYTNRALIPLGSLYCRALLILTKSSYRMSKNQVVHEQKFKDLLSSKRPVSVERSMLDLET